MSHSTKIPSISKTTSQLPTDVEDGTVAFATDQNSLVVKVGSAWEKGGGSAGETPTVVYDDGTAVGITDQLQGDIPDYWKDTDTSLRGLVIGTSCTNIGYYAFRNCTGLAGSLTIPGSVTNIEDLAFKSCGFDGSLTIGNGVTTIGGQVFRDCDFTGPLTIPNSVITIGSYPFRDCNFSNLNIGNGFGNTFDDFTFYGTQFSEITVDSQNPYLKTDVNNSLLFSHDLSILWSFAKNTTHGDVVIPNSVIEIGAQFDMFQNSLVLTSIVFSENITGKLPDFSFCTNLAGTITIPAGVTWINNFTDTQISGLISIPAGVTYIDYSAFKNCSNIERFEIHATTAPSYIGGNAFLNTSPTDGNIHVPVGAIGYAASYNGLTVVYDL
jgi:hypothetical protein